MSAISAFWAWIAKARNITRSRSAAQPPTMPPWAKSSARRFPTMTWSTRWRRFCAPISPCARRARRSSTPITAPASPRSRKPFMPLLDHGVVVADRFANSLVPLADLQAAPASAAGVIVGPTTRPEELAPFLPHLALIAIEFPKFRDGRGFSLARALREQHGFDGEIRAIGHLLPDQHAFLL